MQKLQSHSSVLCCFRNLTKVLCNQEDKDGAHPFAGPLADMVQNRLQQTVFVVESMIKKVDEIVQFRLNRPFY